MSVDRQERLKGFLETITIPSSYYQNKTSEGKLLEFAKKFTVYYHKFFPDRKPLLLTPKNEVGVEKMICTYIRPTSVPYDDLFEMEKCSAFIAGYMRYEPLHDPSHYFIEGDDTIETLPKQVISPCTSLQSQMGNCLEFSLILTSLLTGAGYNAYVVVGYGATPVCLNDQSNRNWDERIPNEPNSDDEDSAAQLVDPEYAVLLQPRPRLKRLSEVAFNLPKALRPASATGKNVPSEVVSQVDLSNPTKEIKAVHCWVMVLRGGRKTVNGTVFIEPSTGETISTEKANTFYLGIESVFNHNSYFVHLAPETPVSEVTYDLTNGALWEPVVSGIGEDEERGDKDAAHQGSATSAPRRNFSETVGSAPHSLLAAELESIKPNVFVPMSWVDILTINPSEYASRYQNGIKSIHYNKAVVHHYAAYSQPDLRVKEVYLPDDKYPDGNQVHVFFEHRADKLRRRSVYPLPKAEEVTPTQYPVSVVTSYRLLKEWYEKGRMKDTVVEGLREFAHEPGKTRIMKFYWKSRVDGLYRREELFYDLTSLRKVKEFYKGRDDKLWYRSASFERPRSVKEINMHSMIAGVGSGAAYKEYVRLDPVRMSQKFLRNEAIPFDKNVAKTTFLSARGQSRSVGEMWMFFQYKEGSIIRPYHMFAKPSSKVEDYIAASAARRPVEPPVKIVAMPGSEPPSDLELFNERKWLNGVETVCSTEIRNKMDEVIDILRKRELDHSMVGQVLSSYDTLRNRPKETEAERARLHAEEIRREESRKDYLAPYIAKMEMPANFDGDYLRVKLTLEQAKQVRDEALLDLKERLIQRGHIMQNRMDREKEEFNNRQLLYQKNCDATAIEHGKEADEFALYCKEATWRMKVLDERLSKHIDQASEKYAMLAKRLSEDPRLAILYA